MSHFAAFMDIFPKFPILKMSFVLRGVSVSLIFDHASLTWSASDGTRKFQLVSKDCGDSLPEIFKHEIITNAAILLVLLRLGYGAKDFNFDEFVTLDIDADAQCIPGTISCHEIEEFLVAMYACDPLEFYELRKWLVVVLEVFKIGYTDDSTYSHETVLEFMHSGTILGDAMHFTRIGIWALGYDDEIVAIDIKSGALNAGLISHRNASAFMEKKIKQSLSGAIYTSGEISERGFCMVILGLADRFFFL